MAVRVFVALSWQVLQLSKDGDRMIGNQGDVQDTWGGMIPSCSPPFAMTRWVAQTQDTYVGALPYNYTNTSIAGFQATHQPGVWMGAFLSHCH